MMHDNPFVFTTATGVRQFDEPKNFYVVDHEEPIWSLRREEDDFMEVYRELIDIVPLKFFKVYDDYVDCKYVLPFVFCEAGLSQECSWSKNDFAKFIDGLDEKYREICLRVMYVEDIRDRLAFLYNKIMDIKGLVVLFYVRFGAYYSSIFNVYLDEKKNGVSFFSGQQVEILFALIESIFQKMYTALDLCVKLVWSIKFVPTDYLKYKKIGFQNRQWSDRKNLSGDYDFSDLENYKYRRLVESMRDEFTHNGSWEADRKLYIRFADGVPVERWILLNDHIDGVPEKYVNRSRFYSSGKESFINKDIPDIVACFLVSVSSFLKGLERNIKVR